jgi:hypothetical protein
MSRWPNRSLVSGSCCMTPTTRSTSSTISGSNSRSKEVSTDLTSSCAGINFRWVLRPQCLLLCFFCTGAIFCVSEPEGTDLVGAVQGDDESSDNPNTSSAGKKRKNRSKAWDHFEEKRDDNGKLYAAQCISCRALIKCGDTSGGNGLNKHIKKYGKCFRKPLSSDHQPIPTRYSNLLISLHGRSFADNENQAR